MAAGRGSGPANTVIRRVAMNAGRAMPWIGLAVVAWELVNSAMNWNAQLDDPVLGPNKDVNCQFNLLPPEECVLTVGDVAITLFHLTTQVEPPGCPNAIKFGFA